MTDRELLELAAKAKQDDGAALRLMVERRITVDFDGSYVSADGFCEEIPENDPLEACRVTRLLIVSAAAEKGGM